MKENEVLDDIEIKMKWETFKATQKKNSEWVVKKVKLFVKAIAEWCTSKDNNDWEKMGKAVENMRLMGVADIDFKFAEEDKKRGTINICIEKKPKEDWYIDIEFETMREEDATEVNKGWLGTINKTEIKDKYDIETYVYTYEVDKEVNEAIQEAMYQLDFEGISFLAKHIRFY